MIYLNDWSLVSIECVVLETIGMYCISVSVDMILLTMKMFCKVQVRMYHAT